MELVGTAVNAIVVAVVGALLAWLAKRRFDGIDHRIDRLEQRSDGRIDELGQRFDGRIDRVEGRVDRLEQRIDHRFDRLEASVGALRSDLTQVALAVGVRPRAENG